MTTAWIGDGADLLADTVGNWDNGIPSSINDAVFDGIGGGAPTKDCTWNIGSVAAVDIKPAYTGKITAAIDVECAAAFSIDSTAGDAAQEFDLAATYTLSVGGAFTDIGLGLGVTNQPGSTVKLAGDCTVDRSASASTSRYENAIFIGSIADEDTFKKRDIDWISGKSQLNKFTIRDNQHFVLTNDLFGLSCLGAGSNVQWEDDGTTQVMAIAGLWVDLQTMAFLDTTDSDKLQVAVTSLLNIEGADFGNARVTFDDDGSMFGAWSTTRKWRFRESGVQIISMEAACSVLCGSMQIGHETNPARQTDLTQKTGSSIISTGDATLNADDTIVTSRWLREAGSIVQIGGSLIVEAEATLDWSATSGEVEVGANITLDEVAVIAFGTTTINLTGTGTIANEGNSNDFYGLTCAAPGKVTTCTTGTDISGGVFTVGGGTFDKGALTMTLVGAAGLQFVGMKETTWLGSGGIIISLTNGDQQVPGGLFNDQLNINLQNVSGEFRTFTVLDDWTTRSVTANASAANMITVELQGDWTFDYFHHGNGIGTGSIWNLNGHTIFFGTWSQGGDLSEMNGPGLVDCNLFINRIGTDIDCSTFTCNVRDDHLVQVGGAFSLGTGDITVKGDFIPIGDANFGSGRYKYYKIFDASGANSVDYGTASIVLGGGSAQPTNIYAGSPYSLRNEKTAGLTTFSVGFTLLDAYISRPRGNINTDFTVGQAFTIDRFDFDNRHAFKETLDSSDSVTPVAITSAVVGPTGRNTDVGRLTLSTGLQDMDDNTCADLGGNTNFNFASLPLPVYSSSMAGMGLGLGLGHLKEQQP